MVPTPFTDAVKAEIRKHFAVEIDHLLAEVPSELWKEPGIRGLMYDFIPWHEWSTLAIQLDEDDPHDPGGWTHYECVNPDGRHIGDEFALYKQANHRLVYHWLLIEAAEALLGFDFTRYGQHETIEDGFLSRLFKLQVYDADQTFSFNYCEYALARRFEHP